ncbi:30S ribosomal protein S6--L-glutamate ligase [Stratiformator vulcanicus]|uniref:Probable alpha-L-glutamate ligase n=1 Tax=Stratiformator vulcanicus TaxID=2527980 RepID=A0A517R2K3_9PLAN|nr:30S ribosomal protein S6--L-glutamate ligase [Stratiformator vulcanicus]QDT38084.1 Ribosomal protein S6 modification protein [Stratiformator vulcanicus]
MKIAILSRDESLYSTRRLTHVAERNGHSVRVIDYLRCSMDITSKRPRVLYQGDELKRFDAVIPRIGVSQTFYGTAVVRQFETMGVRSLNSSTAISCSRDKLRSMQQLAAAGLPMPTTGFAHLTKDIGALIDLVGGPPLVIKLLEGTQGIGVILAESRNVAEAVIEAFRGLDANILVQQYVAEAHGIDYRALVVGGEVVAAIERRAEAGGFRSNLHRGGKARRIDLSTEMIDVAVKAAEVSGLNLAGIDLLPSDRGPLVMEVNSSPGLEGVEKATQINVAGEIIGFLESDSE